MKKLLSLFTISAILGSASSNVIACKVKIYKVDISDDNYYNFPQFTLAHIYNQGLIFQNIYAQIGSWGNPIQSVNTIKNDKNISIIVIRNGQEIKYNAETNKKPILSNDTFKVTITVKNDKYFDDVKNKEISFKINKIDLTDVELKDFTDEDKPTNIKGSDIYANIRTQIISWANSTLTTDKIKEDNKTILLAVYINDKLVKDDNTDWAVNYQHKYTLKLKINDDNEWFKNINKSYEYNGTSN